MNLHFLFIPFLIQWNQTLSNTDISIRQKNLYGKVMIKVTEADLIIKTAATRWTCTDPEVRNRNTEESILYFIRRKYNIF